MKRTLLSLLLSSCLGTVALAHEGHNKTPGVVQAPHGGVVQGTSQLYVELVNDASGIKLYPLTHDLAPVSPGDVAIVVTSQVPKRKKEAVSLQAVEDHFEGKVEARDAYRYSLVVETTYKGKKEKVTFQVEPQS